jgi:hypothetical protein
MRKNPPDITFNKKGNDTLFEHNIGLIYFQVMNAKGKIYSFSLLYGMFIMIVLNPATVSSTAPLCQSRCEEAVPNLRRLKQLWHTLSKREGNDGKVLFLFIELMSKCLFKRFNRRKYIS